MTDAEDDADVNMVDAVEVVEEETPDLECVQGFMHALSVPMCPVKKVTEMQPLELGIVEVII